MQRFLMSTALAGLLMASSACQTAPTVKLIADDKAPAAEPVAAKVTFEQERQAILAMVGDFKVTFDFTETVPFVVGYTLKEPKLSGGYEIVRVVEDTGRFISLQHILVVGPEDDPIVVKHWRQDWQYEPDSVLVFIGGNAWENRAVPEFISSGAWSQTVYQVDDAPRYGAVGRWHFDGGIAEWVPPAEWRPMPRRDMTTREDYNAVDAINRHTITPWGWVHEQDNTKLVLTGETPVALVREIGVNTYRQSDEFDPTPALDYWDATKDYWAHVRRIWSRIATENAAFAITLKGETEDLYGPLLNLAGSVQSGELTLKDAEAEAEKVIAHHTTADIGELTSRLRKTSPLPGAS